VRIKHLAHLKFWFFFRIILSFELCKVFYILDLTFGCELAAFEI